VVASGTLGSRDVVGPTTGWVGLGSGISDVGDAGSCGGIVTIGTVGAGGGTGTAGAGVGAGAASVVQSGGIP
jgi:hypothetical protein